MTEIVWPPELERVPIWPFVGNICQPLKGSYITVRRKEKGGEARLLEGFMRSGGEFGSSFYHAHAAKGLNPPLKLSYTQIVLLAII